MAIITLIEQIKNHEVVLPAIQRDFVWSEKKISKLCDSIMRGYPIGIILLWETYNDIQYRKFVNDYRSDPIFTFHENQTNKRLKLVLDGQQRLQSLYIALYGTYEGQYLYFDMLSGRETENFKEDKFSFQFMTPAKAEKLNEDYLNSIQNQESETKEDSNGYTCYARVNDLISWSPKEKQHFKKDIIKKYDLSEDDETRLDINLTTMRDVLSSEGNILKTATIDEDRPSNSPDRKSESDVLEAFVRINREGTPLSRSDLIFSMLKLNWKESATTLPEFVREINQGNSFEFDSDFVIRCLFVVSDLGSKFDIDILRKRSNVEKIKANFNKCCDAIRSAADFIQNECWISSSRLIGGYFNIVPLVYYLFHTKNHQVPESETDKVRKALYLLGFSSPFSRYADSRLNKFIREELKPLVGEEQIEFPFADTVYWAWHWEKISDYGSELIQGNPSLALHLVQRKSGARVLYDKNSPQIDHIFPRSVLRKKGLGEAEINHFANFWILAKDKNLNKSNKHPKKYFEKVQDSVMKRAHIDKVLLNYGRYRTFLKKREQNILAEIKRELSLSDGEYSVRTYYKVD